VNGYLRLKKIDLNDLWLYPPTWTYTYGDISDRFYAGNMRRFDDTILSNHIRVLGGSSQYAEVLFDLKVDENEYEKKIEYVDDLNIGNINNLTIE
jgi:hypothetical protein